VTTALCYVYPNLQPGKYQALARQFARTYIEHPPGTTDHEIYVVVNGFPDAKAERLFEPLPVKLLSHNNWAKDLGAFLLAAHTISCDLLVMMGSHVNFWRAGWLDQIANAFMRYGPAVGGAFAMQVPEPHLRTTFWWTSPEILLTYPFLQSDSDRYFFEHSKESIALWSEQRGFAPYQLTWRGCFAREHWHPVTREEALAWDQHTQRELGR
jgi:hypothetical protein